MENAAHYDILLVDAVKSLKQGQKVSEKYNLVGDN